MIFNHFTATLSDLDIQMVRSVPPGGNWKDIPESIPSKRLKQIRESFKAGKGSRSTYYGRLRADAPAYTISTYFNRPGNGCYIHYDFDGGQHRLISQREAARFQSFPDHFDFCGNRTEVNKQIGNAVPPLLAHQIATALPFKGLFLDLFCGAGGLSLGFHWAGWCQVVANDIEPVFLKTYEKNLGGKTTCGDISDNEMLQKIVDNALAMIKKHPTLPRIVLGGPPCQGFSTAGNRRSMKDKRNHLFKQYAIILKKVRPDVFIFENVPGLKNMEGGAVLHLITSTLGAIGYRIKTYTLRCEEYGVPQRRTRIFIYGIRPEIDNIEPPAPITAFNGNSGFFNDLPEVISAKEAIDDLPPLRPGEDGRNFSYITNPSNDYQRFCRGDINANQYINNIRERVRSIV